MTPGYLTHHPEPTAKQLECAGKLEADAVAARQRAEESFQRCDTDGFLSQWACSIGADKDRENARVLRNGGYDRFPVLVDADGTVVSETIRRFPHPRFDWRTVEKWQVNDPHVARLGRRWVPVGSRSRIQKELKLQEEDRWYPAVAIITTGNATSTGLAGAANAYVTTVKRSVER